MLHSTPARTRRDLIELAGARVWRVLVVLRVPCAVPRDANETRQEAMNEQSPPPDWTHIYESVSKNRDSDHKPARPPASRA